MFQFYGRTLDVARTAVHYGMFVILGLMMSIPGPTLIDLRHSSGADSFSISYIFPARSIGYLIGSLTGGVILDCLKNEQIALMISCFFVSLGAYLIPWCRSLTMLLATFALTGFAMGFSNTGSNACCLQIWGKKGAPFLQGLHFAYGIGGFLAPLLAAPFLSKQVPIPSDLTLLGVTQNITNELLGDAPNTTEIQLRITPNEVITVPSITIAYTIVGILATFVTGCFLLVHLFSAQGRGAEDQGKEPGGVQDPGMAFTALVVTLACLQTGLVSGVEVSFAQMLTSYVVKSIHNLSKVTGSYMTSVYWGSFTLTRMLSILLACRVSVRNLLVFDLALAVSASLLLLGVGSWSEAALWAGTALLGVGVASIFPASLSWIEKYININNRIASVFTLVSSMLEMTVPLTISIYLGTQPNVLFQFMVAATVLCCVLFAILNVILNRKGEKYIAENPTSKEEPPSVKV